MYFLSSCGTWTKRRITSMGKYIDLIGFQPLFNKPLSVKWQTSAWKSNFFAINLLTSLLTCNYNLSFPALLLNLSER